MVRQEVIVRYSMMTRDHLECIQLNTVYFKTFLMVNLDKGLKILINMNNSIQTMHVGGILENCHVNITCDNRYKGSKMTLR